MANCKICGKPVSSGIVAHKMCLEESGKFCPFIRDDCVKSKCAIYSNEFGICSMLDMAEDISIMREVLVDWERANGEKG